MNRSARRNGAVAPRARFMPAAVMAMCVLSAAARAAPQSPSAPEPSSAQPPPSARHLSAAPKPSAAPAPVAPSPAQAAPATDSAPPPAAPNPPQPAAARATAGEGPIRRDAPRADASLRTPSTAPANASGAPGYNVPRVLGALTLVLGLIFALRWVLRRTGHPGFIPGTTSAVQVLTRSPLSPRQQVLLVRVGRRLLVVADCNGQLNALSEITDADEVAALVGQLRDEKLTSASKSFGNLLGMWRRGAEAPGDEEDADADAEPFPRAAPDVPLRGEARPGEIVDDVGGENDPSVASARSEIHGLMERVRLISHQFKR